MVNIIGQSIRWRLLCRQAIFWIAAELALNIVGLDNLIDCIEYLLTRQKQAAIVQPVTQIALSSSIMAVQNLAECLGDFVSWISL